MSARTRKLPALAHLGGTRALTTTPIVGTPARAYDKMYVPGTEPLGEGEIRVTVLGSGDPFIKRSQASGSLVIEVGNPEKDLFFFDLGSGALANFSSLLLPVESTNKVFLSHLHADHVGDIPGLLGSVAKIGRIDPVEIWGGGSEDPELGLATYVMHMNKAMAWDRASLLGVRPTTGLEAIAHEIPYDRPYKVYERNGVTISSFPSIHGLSGAVATRSSTRVGRWSSPATPSRAGSWSRQRPVRISSSTSVSSRRRSSPHRWACRWRPRSTC